MFSLAVPSLLQALPESTVASEPSFTGTGRILLESLRELNRESLAAPKALKLLLGFEEVAEHAADGLCGTLTGLSHPLIAGKWQQANLARSLHLEMARGYTEIARQLTGTNHRRTHRWAAQAVYHALDHLGLTLCISYQIYQPVPSGVWRNTHRLYAFAEKHHLELEPLEPAHVLPRHTTTIAERYKQILLMAASVPYGLDSSAQARLRESIGLWSAHVTVHAPTYAAAGPFRVMLNSDLPPARHDAAGTAEREQFRVLDTGPLISRLHNQLASAKHQTTVSVRLSDDNEDQPFELSFLRHLFKHWSGTTKRRTGRAQSATRIRLAMGLEKARQCMAGPVPYLSAAQPDADPALRPDASRGAMPQTAQCMIINRSSSGLCCLWRSAEPSKLRVGQVVALPGAADGSVWAAGVIRWLRRIDNSVVFGVEILAPGAEPIGIHPDTTAASDRNFIGGLLLPRNGRRAASILAPAGLYAANDRLLVQHRGKRYRIRLARCLEGTKGGDHFLFETISVLAGDRPQPQAVAPAVGPSQSAAPHFASGRRAAGAG